MLPLDLFSRGAIVTKGFFEGGRKRGKCGIEYFPTQNYLLALRSRILALDEKKEERSREKSDFPFSCPWSFLVCVANLNRFYMRL
jgi:hypothetical protein